MILEITGHSVVGKAAVRLTPREDQPPSPLILLGIAVVEVEPLQPLHNIVRCHELVEKLLAQDIRSYTVLAVIALVASAFSPAVVRGLLHN